MVGVNLRRLAFAVPGAALLIAGIYAAGERGAADVHYYTARTLLDKAASAERLPSETELNLAEAALRESLAREPSNPLFVEQLARTHEMRSGLLKPGDPAARESLRRALAQYRAAALMRPGSPFVWAGIASIKLRLDDVDYEFYGALQRASSLGPWEPAVQLALADIGLASWRLLAQPGKVVVLEAIARAMPHQGKEIRRLAEMHRTLPLVCAQEVTLRPQGTGLCVKK